MISIIIPTFNEEKFLPKLLESLRTQAYDDVEIIVSDASSVDHTVAIAKHYGCRVVISTTQSPAYQRNTGVAVSHGDILFFLDADTILPPNCIEQALQEFQKKQLDVAGFYYTLDSKRPLLRLASLYTKIFFTGVSKFFPIIAGAAMLVKKQYFDAVGGFDETLYIGEDNVFTKSVVKNGGKYALLTSVGVTVSARRYEQEGPWKSYFKLQYILLYFLLNGKINKKIVHYNFGKYETK
jgi:glycosyltransferase involved in cell wall biosynthesis